MLKLNLLLFLLLPAMLFAQEVQPVISNDYLLLIRNDTAVLKRQGNKMANSIRQSPLRFLGGDYNGLPIKRIILGGDSSLTLVPNKIKEIYIGGSATSTLEWQRAGRRPSLQNDYAQGRSENGILKWQGPETGELFSYGPAINTLEFDGIPYAHDVNGRLVNKGGGNGITANVYNNDIFRNTVMFSQGINFQARLRKNYQQYFATNIKAGQSVENTIIKNNRNKAGYFSAGIERVIKTFTARAAYNYREQHFSNSNRNGFLNRVYQAAILTPVSFNNNQPNNTGNLQNSYSRAADNPNFLLNNEEHFLDQQQQNASLQLEQKYNKLKIKLNQSIELVTGSSNEGYQPGTAFFENGIKVKRDTKDRNYFLHGNVQYDIPNGGKIKMPVVFNYIFAANKSDINYITNTTAYQYQRASQDVALSIMPGYEGNNVEANLYIANKIYASNTAVKNQWLIPTVRAFTQFRNVFNINGLQVKLNAGYNQSYNELPVDKSFSQNSLVAYTVANAQQYLPVMEVETYKNLLPVSHKEFSAGVEIEYQYKMSLTANWYNRKTYNDIFSVVTNNRLQLKNMADHRNKGFEIELNLLPRLWGNGRLNITNSLSFTTYNSKVTNVSAGYDHTPIAGFADVHKAIVKGEPLGTIVGNSYLKNQAGQTIIGADGFPVADNKTTVIGNPIPDFVVKWNHQIVYKKWNFNVGMEWKNGGDIWNGTASQLDYYGRSATSAAQRNVTGYIFNGVQQNGTHNATPVKFYDAILPISQNRWVRYGPAGVAQTYIQKADCIRLNNIGIGYKIRVKRYIQQISFSLYASNIILWTPYQGADPHQLLYDQNGTSGLDFFNLPSYQSYGFTTAIQF